MPKLVDHEERRRELGDAVWRVTESGRRWCLDPNGRPRGRLVAGCAAPHYFSTQSELLTFAMQMVVERDRGSGQRSRASGRPASSGRGTAPRIAAARQGAACGERGLAGLRRSGPASILSCALATWRSTRNFEWPVLRRSRSWAATDVFAQDSTSSSRPSACTDCLTGLLSTPRCGLTGCRLSSSVRCSPVISTRSIPKGTLDEDVGLCRSAAASRGVVGRSRLANG